MTQWRKEYISAIWDPDLSTFANKSCDLCFDFDLFLEYWAAIEADVEFTCPD